MVASARAGALIWAVAWISQGIGQAATVRDAKTASPVAVATAANVEYCFARPRGLEPERLPQAYLVLRLHVTVSYLNEGTRAVILPLERVRTIYTALKPGQMSVFKPGLGLLASDLKVMNHLPPDVGPDSPVDPKNDVFGVIPAGGQLTPPLTEEVILPVNRQGVFRKYPDLRGRRVYVKLRFAHQKLDPALEANLSDRWSRFGVPWTGTLTTNTILIDVPAAPKAEPCTDKYTPAHPVVGVDDQK